MSDIPNNRSQMAALMREVMAADPSAQSQSPLTDEEIAVVATRGLDGVPESMRQRVLQQAVVDPEAAQLLRDAVQLDLEDSVVVARRKRKPVKHFMQLTYVAWAAAACLVLSLGVWRFADPPRDVTSTGGGMTIHSLSVDRPVPDYWNQVERERLMDQAQSDRLRDYALLASSLACLILSIPVAIRVIRHDSGPRQP